MTGAASAEIRGEPAPVRVMLVDDHLLVRRGLASLLSATQEFELVAAMGDAVDVVEVARESRADVVLMDIRMPGGDGVQATRRLRQELPDVKVIVLTAYEDDEYLFAALRAGAHAFLLKSSSYDELTETVREVAGGRRLLSPEVLDRVLREFAAVSAVAARAQVGLSEREIDILAMMAEGLSNREIAERVHWSEATVKRKIEDIFAKLQVTNRVQAVAEAIRRGLI